MIRKTLLFLFFFGASLLAQTNVELLGQLNPYPNLAYTDIWGYATNGREYALMGVTGGTSIIDVTNPASPVEVDFISGPAAPPYEWRDIKTHLNYAYVVTEGTGSGQGLQIIDLSNLPTSASLVNTVDTWFSRAHDIFIDNGYAYVVGTNDGGGMHILDLSDPVNPTETAYYTTSGYIHDLYVWNDTAVVCAGNTYDLVDVSNKNNPQFISASTPISGIDAHSGWMTEDKRYFFGTEEGNQVDITVWDLQDRTSWDLVVSSWETNSGATVHNLFILGDYAHISYYSDGYVVLDISNPEIPFLVGEYSTSALWGCYPYLPSGITIGSDMNNGLYVFQFTAADVPPTIIHSPILEVFDEDPVMVSATIVDNEQVTAANLRYRTTINGNTGDWNLVTDPNGPSNNVYEFEIPGYGNQTTVEYYISAQDNNNNVSTLPDGGSGTNPPGSTPPSNFFSYTVMIAGAPVLISVSPESDTTVAPNGVVPFHVEAIDTSGFSLSYSYFKNGELVDNDATYIYLAAQNPNFPRVDTIVVKISNGSFEIEFTWLVTVENPTGLEDINSPLSYSLKQNYPNPFNPSTNIKYSVPENVFVKLTVYNLVGEEVSILVNKTVEAGFYEATFDAANLPSGTYFYKLQAGSFVETKKMILLR